MEEKVDKRGRPSTADTVREVLVDALKELRDSGPEKEEANPRQIFKQSRKGYKGGHLDAPEEQAKFDNDLLKSLSIKVFNETLGHEMGPFVKSVHSDPERIPPLPPPTDVWVSRCRVCGLGGFASFRHRSLQDPKRKADPYTITDVRKGTWLGGPAGEISCGAARRNPKLGRGDKMNVEGW